jgi:poly [ADP-ribose] polymerase
MKTFLKPAAKLLLKFMPDSVKKSLLEWLDPKVLNPIQGAAQQLKQITTTPTPTPPRKKDGEPESSGAKEQQLRSCYLIMVAADANNNKYYKMQERADGTFEVTYGRVGSNGASENYPMEKWDSKYREKVRKGYVDQSVLFVDGHEIDLGLDKIENIRVRSLIQKLQDYAKKSIRYHYNINAEQVTPAQVNEAQRLIDALSKSVEKGMKLDSFNAALLQLFTVIPRKMKNVRDHLVTAASNTDDLDKIQRLLADEQATLDVMRSQVDLMEQRRQHSASTKLNLLEIMGMKIEPVEESDIITLIKKMMQEESRRFVTAYRVVNSRTASRFEQQIAKASNQTTELFWHGSRNENWMSILESGLVLKPANAVITGKMFGYGLYFADRFRKSLNYTSIDGSSWAGGSAASAYLAIFKVHTGNMLKVKKHESVHMQFTAAHLQKKGNYDSVFAMKGVDLVNNEYIVYHDTQCTIEYLVEIKK